MSNPQSNITVGGAVSDSVLVSGSGNIIIIQTRREVSQESLQSSSRRLGPNPYRGLSAFQERDAQQFFGRTAQIHDLSRRFRDLSTYKGSLPCYRWLTIYGPSGSGKSSLARAGLLPELVRHPPLGLEQLRVLVVLPGASPIQTLAESMAKVVGGDQAQGGMITEFVRTLETRDDNHQFDGLSKIARKVPTIDNIPLIILIDQFETIFSVDTAEEGRNAFIENLLFSSRDSFANIFVITTLRSDFLRYTQNYSELSQIISKQGFLVPAMNDKELEDAICLPAIHGGAPLDKGTVKCLLASSSRRTGVLPLLQFALNRIWDGMEMGIDSMTTLNNLGGVGGALAAEADHLYNKLEPEDKIVVRRIFSKLVQPGDGVPDTRKREQMERIYLCSTDRSRIDRIVAAFSDANVRLLTLAINDHGDDTLEITHEALIEHWKTLHGWLSELRDDYRFRQRLSDSALHWLQQDKADGCLWRPPDLELLRRYCARMASLMDPLDEEFFQKSDQAEIQRNLDAIKAKNQLIESRQRAVAIAMAARAQMLWREPEGVGAKLESIILLAAEALRRYVTTEAADVVRRGLDIFPGKPVADVILEDVDAIVFNGDTQLIAVTTKSDNPHILPYNAKISVRSLDIPIWERCIAVPDLCRGSQIASMLNSIDGCGVHDTTSHFAIAVSSSGSLIATVGSNGNLSIWDTAKGIAKRHIEQAAKTTAASVALSGDGLFVAVADVREFAGVGLLGPQWQGSRIQIWNTETGESIFALDHWEPSTSVALNGTGTYVAVGFRSGSVIVWRVNPRAVIQIFSSNHLPYRTGLYEVSGLAFDWDAKLIAAHSQTEGTRIWDMSSGLELLRVEHYGGYMLALNRAGNLLITADKTQGGHIKTWKFPPGRKLAEVDYGNGRSVAYVGSMHYSIRYNRGEITVHQHGFSESALETIRQAVASMDDPEQIEIFLLEKIKHRANQTIAIRYGDRTTEPVSLSSNAKWAAAGAYGSFGVWDANSGEVVKIIERAGVVDAIQIDDNALFLAVAEHKNEFVEVWNLQSARVVHRVRRALGEPNLLHDVPKISLSRDGVLLAVSTGARAFVYDLTLGSQISVVGEFGTHAVALSRDGQWLATGRYAPGRTSGSIIQVWNIRNGQEVFRQDFDDYAYVLVFREDDWLAVAGLSDNIKIYQWKPDQLIHEVEKRIERKLTKEDWERLLPANLEI